MPKKINIKSKTSPARRHVRFLKLMEKQADTAYRYITLKMRKELEDLIKQEKLTKSDPLGTGWTGAVPTVRMDITKSANKVIGKYMQALTWVMVGDYAGKDARRAAKDAGIIDKVTPGIMQASYLNSIDMNREYYKIITGLVPPDMPAMMVKYSIEKIVDRTVRQIEQIAGQLENSLMFSIEAVFDDFDNKNQERVRKEAQKLEGEAEEVLDQAATKAKDKISKTLFNKEVKKVTDKFKSTWSRNVAGETGVASGVGAHQSVSEIFGNTSGSMKVIVLTSKDDRVCGFCNKMAYHPDGSFKYYNLNDFKPAGYNFGRKREDWGVSVPTHINCRCVMVYVPNGFKVKETGELVPA